MKKLYSILSLLLISVVAHAQPYETNPDFNRTRNWLFGDKIGLHFSPDTIIFTGSEMPPTEACAVLSDKEGNLLLYSNGEKIWDANHKVIHNGNLSLGNISSRMGAVFIFHEETPNNIYLLNTNEALSSNKELSINLIIKEADTFRVVYKDSVLQTNVCEAIAVVKSSNGSDAWIVTQEFNGSTFIAYRLTKTGLIYCPIFSNTKSYVGGHNTAALSAMKFSVDGKYLIKSNTLVPTPTKTIELYKFDNEKGTFDFLYSLDSFKSAVHGLNFSKSLNNLYVIERDHFVNIFSFNPEDSSYTANSKRQFQLNGYQHLGMFKYEIQNLTYSENLALAVLDSAYLPIFEDNEIIDSINAIDKGIYLEGRSATLGLPNFNQSYFYTPSINFTFKLNCITNTMQFNGQDTFQANTHNWVICKQGNSVITADTKAPLIEFADSGTYNVRYIATIGSRSDTVTKEITILPKINQNFLGNDTGWCDQLGASLTLQAPSGMHCYEWSNGSTSNEIIVDTTGSYFVKITTPNFCVLHDTINITIDLTPEKPIIYQNHDTLKTDAIARGYQWYRNNQPIGANNSYLKIYDTGIYYLSITSNTGCLSQSDTLLVYRVGTKAIEILDYKVYPNPFNDEFVIEMKEKSEIQITAYNSIGQEVFTAITNDNLFKINTSQWNQGVYFMEITQSNGIKQVIKLIK